MSEEDWRYLEALMYSFGAFLSDIPYGHRDKAWWDKFHEFDNKIKEQIKKVQPLEDKRTPKPSFKPGYEPEESIDGKLKKFTIKKEEEE